MKILEYPTYDDYLDTQRAVTHDKKRRRIQYVHSPDCRVIARKLRPHLTDGDALCCHGARSGYEVRWLGQSLEGVTVYGTDLVGGAEGVHEHDFNKPLGAAFPSPRAIYSNSLDHSPDPAATLNVWAKDVGPGGVLAVHWGAGSHDDRHVKGADCFGASRKEYREMLGGLRGVESVEEQRWFNAKGRLQVLFVAKMAAKKRRKRKAASDADVPVQG